MTYNVFSGMLNLLSQILVMWQAGDSDVGELMKSMWQSLSALRQIISSFQLMANVQSQAAEISSLRTQVQNCVSIVALNSIWFCS